MDSTEQEPIVQDAAAQERVSRHALAATIGRNTVWGVVSKLVQVSTRLVTIPIVIAHLGLGGYGIWSIIMTTAAYMRFGSVGIKSAFQKYVAEATGSGDYETTNKLLSTGCAAMLGLSLLGMIPVAIFSTGLARASGVPPEFLHSAAGSISVLAVIMVFSNVGAVYEAIVMGGHRIDLARNFTTIFTVAEAIAIVILLHFGQGLFAMAAVMAASEAGFILSCYLASKKVVPQVHVRREFVTGTVVNELIRFAGSYQLLSVLEVLYGAILPIAILRQFGAESAGIYALAIRLAQSVLMLPDAFLLPILSGGAMVFGSGSVDQMRLLITKSFKATMGLGLFPLTFLSIFGSTMVFAWTGRADASFRMTLVLVCVAGLFHSFSILGVVLYRVSGKALLDNIRQAFCIVSLLVIALFAHRTGFYGVLAGLAVAELLGMLLMVFAVTNTFHTLGAMSLVRDAVKLIAATALVVVVALAVDRWVPSLAFGNERWSALFRLGKVSLACLCAAWPAFMLTGAVTRAESRVLINAILPRSLQPAQAAAERAG